MCSGAASGPRLNASMRMQMSSGVDLGVLDDDVEVAVLVEDAGVEQLELGALAAAAAVLLDQPAVGKLGLRILVEELHVRVRRRVVEVEVVLLDVLAVVALAGRQAEEPLLEDRVAAVPEGGGEDEELVAIADAGDAVLAPAIGLAAGQVVRQVVPGVAVGAVVLAHGGPGAVADVRPPAPPAADVVLDFLQAGVFARAHETHFTLKADCFADVQNTKAVEAAKQN